MDHRSCSVCKRNPSYYKREYEGTVLCKSCFRDSLERKVRRTISQWDMLNPKDHVAVAVSGGKDSLTLLMILHKLAKRFPRTKITAVTVDEGIAGYREEAVDLASRYCREMEIEHEVVSFEELFGYGLDDYLKQKQERMTACSYCGVWRRKAINLAAKKVGATKIATAHNLDDIVQTYMLNLFQGDAERFVRFSPVLKDPRGLFLSRVKPLCEIPEREIVMYGYAQDFQFQTASCPYMTEALRNELRSMLNKLELAHPGVTFSAYKAMLRLRALSEPNLEPSRLQSCKSCGEPTPFEICEACKMQGIATIVPNLSA